VKKLLSLITLLLLLICAFVPILKISPAHAYPNVIFVDDDNTMGPWDGSPQHPYQNVTSGLANALAGDTIYVYNGTYREQLTINKPVSLIGDSKYNTVIDGKNIGNVIKITAANVNVTHFTIQNSLSVYQFSGIRLENSTGSNISYNIIVNNYEGIWLQNSSQNTFIDNDISNSSEGIYTVDSNNNTFTGNKISNNEFGMVLRNSINNTIFHNSFIDNTWRSVSAINSTNPWDNGIEGNYWSDYTGQDNDQNGIGDSPYIIDANSQDYYPLMGIFYDFIVFYESETFHVFTICNSTITRFEFNETIKMLDLNVTGADDTAGFCRITLLQLLVARPCIVLVENSPVNATVLPKSSTENTLLYFTYNHTERKIQILSKPYYELLQKYNTLYEDYQNLNSTLYQLIYDCNLLNQTYQQLQLDFLELKSEYEALNQTYWQLQANYTQLQSQYDSINQTYQQLLDNWTRLLADYDTLSQTYEETLGNYTTLQDDYNLLWEEHETLNQTCQEALSNYTILQTDYNNLSQTYSQILNNYTELTLEHNILYHTYQELMTNHTRLQNDYISIQLSYDSLLAEYDSLNSQYANTWFALLCVSVAAIAITLTTTSLTIKFQRRSKQQEKLAEKYKSELERVSILDVARSKFEADIKRRKGKIQSFERKYGVTIRPRATLEEAIKSLDIKRKKEER
jgi:parallel beta-helix repeat protein